MSLAKPCTHAVTVVTVVAVVAAVVTVVNVVNVVTIVTVVVTLDAVVSYYGNSCLPSFCLDAGLCVSTGYGCASNFATTTNTTKNT